MLLPRAFVQVKFVLSLSKSNVCQLTSYRYSTAILTSGIGLKRKPTMQTTTLPQICNVRSVTSAPSDFGKFAPPGKIETFYQWFTDTSWIHLIEGGLTLLHNTTGLPWWASIALATVTLRVLIMTPIFVSQMKNNIKYHQFLPLFQKVSEKLAEEVEEASKLHNWDAKTKAIQFSKNLSRHRTNMYKKYKVPGLFRRYMLPLVQVPLWISMSISLRHLTGSLSLIKPPGTDMLLMFMQLSQEGCLWFSNLCHIDNFYAMPVLLGVVNLSIIEIYRGDGKTKLEGLGKVLVVLARALSVIMVPIACQMPSGVVLYWLCSSMYGAAQALAFRSHRVKRIFGIPVSPKESQTPYRDLYMRLPILKNRGTK